MMIPEKQERTGRNNKKDEKRIAFKHIQNNSKYSFNIGEKETINISNDIDPSKQ